MYMYSPHFLNNTSVLAYIICLRYWLHAHGIADEQNPVHFINLHDAGKFCTWFLQWSHLVVYFILKPVV